MPLPPRIQNAPELEPGLEFYYEAFHRLTTSRQMGHGAVGAIPYRAISGFCKDEGVVGEMREDLFYHVEHLDEAYIKWQTKKAAQEQAQAAAQAKAKAKPRGGRRGS